MDAKSVIIFSASTDTAVAKVVDRLHVRGIKAETVHTDHFPGLSSATLQTGGAQRTAIRFASASKRVALLEADAVWVRRIRLNQDLTTEWDGATTAAVQKQSLEALVGMLAIFDGPVLDPLPKVRAASAKPSQLVRASRLGLHVPRSLVTNDPHSARQFVQDSLGPVVTKPVDTLVIPGANGGTSGMYTSMLGDNDISALDEIRWCPMILQEMIPKVADVRATVIGDDVFTASLPFDETATSPSDWRRGTTGGGWVPHELPDVVSAALLALVRSFGLTYSAADFIRTGDDEYVFLESNPGGEWTWLEEQLGLGIPDAIARVIQLSL